MTALYIGQPEIDDEAAFADYLKDAFLAQLRNQIGTFAPQMEVD
jgi:hypothetical protein